MQPSEHDEISQQRRTSVDDGIDVPIEQAPDPAEKPIADQLAEIAADAKALAETEIAYYRAKLDANVSRTKRVLAFFGFGLAFGTAGLTALVLGLLMTLAPRIGPGPATAIVAGGFCLLGGALIFWSIRKAKRLPLDGDS